MRMDGWVAEGRMDSWRGRKVNVVISKSHIHVMLLINEDMVLENAYHAFKSTIHVLSKKNETRHVRSSSSTFNPNDNTFLRAMVSWVIFLSARNGFFTLKWRLVCCFLGDSNTRRQSEDDTWQGTTEMLRPIMHWNAKQKWLQSWNTWTSICKDIKLILFTLDSSISVLNWSA